MEEVYWPVCDELIYISASTYKKKQVNFKKSNPFSLLKGS